MDFTTAIEPLFMIDNATDTYESIKYGCPRICKGNSYAHAYSVLKGLLVVWEHCGVTSINWLSGLLTNCAFILMAKREAFQHNDFDLSLNLITSFSFKFVSSYWSMICLFIMEFCLKYQQSLAEFCQPWTYRYHTIQYSSPIRSRLLSLRERMCLGNIVIEIFRFQLQNDQNPWNNIFNESGKF